MPQLLSASQDPSCMWRSGWCLPQCPAGPQPQKSLRLSQDYVQRSICSHLKQCYLGDVGKERFGKPKQKYSMYCICLCNLANFSKCKSS